MAPALNSRSLNIIRWRRANDRPWDGRSFDRTDLIWRRICMLNRRYVGFGRACGRLRWRTWCTSSSPPSTAPCRCKAAAADAAAAVLTEAAVADAVPERRLSVSVFAHAGLNVDLCSSISVLFVLRGPEREKMWSDTPLDEHRIREEFGLCFRLCKRPPRGQDVAAEGAKARCGPAGFMTQQEGMT